MAHCEGSTPARSKSGKPFCGSMNGLGHCADAENIAQTPRFFWLPSIRPAGRRSRRHWARTNGAQWLALVAQLRAVAITGLADPESPAGQSNADLSSRHRRFGHLAALTHGKCVHLPSGQRMADLLFSKGLFQQFVLHAEFGEHLLEPPVLLLDHFRLADHRCIHAAILRSPLVERCIPSHGL